MDRELASTSTASMDMELASAFSKELLDLSDDCLFRVFRNLPQQDLNMVNVTCSRLHCAVVESNFHKYYSGVRHSDFGTIARGFHPNPTAYKLDCIEWYLSRFGHLIQGAKINQPCSGAQNEIFILITKYCSDRLRMLHLSNVSLDLETILTGRSLFSNLSKMEVDNHVDWDRTFPLCMNLVELLIELCLHICEANGFSLNYTFPKLKKFAITFSRDGIERYLPELNLDDALHSFLIQHSKITSLSMNWPYALDMPFMSKLKNLEEIHLRGHLPKRTMNLQPFSALTKLHKFEADDFFILHSAPFLSESQSVSTLQHLSLQHVSIEDEAFITGLSNFRNLRYLSLSVHRYTQLPELVWQKLRKLTLLQELHLNGGLRYENNAFIRMFLKYLRGSHQALEKCSLRTFWKDLVGFVSNLSHYKRLRELTVETDKYNMYDRLRKLRIFRHVASLKDLTLIYDEKGVIAGVRRDISSHKVDEISFLSRSLKTNVKVINFRD